MIRELFPSLLGAEAPPVAPADLSQDPRPTDPSRHIVLGWIAVVILGLFIMVNLIAILPQIFH
jgi:hypothetical protein